MKRLFVTLLVFCLLFSLAACSGTPTAPESGKTPAESAKPATASPGGPEFNGDPALPEVPADYEGGFSVPEAPAGFVFHYAGKDSDGVSFYGDAEPSPVSGSSDSKDAGEGRTDSGDPAPEEPGDEPTWEDPVLPGEPVPGEALKLTAAEWNDNRNWPFFTNLINAGTIEFPSFGLDPRNRIEVLVTVDSTLAVVIPCVNETVTLLDPDGKVLWTARTDKTGTAYVFWAEGQTPDRVVCGEASAPVNVPEAGSDPQGQTTMKRLDNVVLHSSGTAPAQTGLQVMFIVDTTGSMVDEIAYLQKDFSAIAERVGNDGVTWSVNFYRDEGDDYVTRTNGFSSDVAEIQAKINAEYADGGGDTPEAVAEILTECLTENGEWRDDAVKLAFLIFDAPPHEGREAALQAAVKAAAEKGVQLIPVVASNAERDTELFGRALAILTNGTYVFLTDDSGVGDSHLEPIVGDYEVELLQDLIVKIIERYR